MTNNFFKANSNHAQRARRGGGRGDGDDDDAGGLEVNLQTRHRGKIKPEARGSCTPRLRTDTPNGPNQ